MAIAEVYSGTATIGTTEYSLTNNSTTVATQTTDGVYQVYVELAAMTAAETYTIRIYEKVIASGTQRMVYQSTRSGVSGGPFVSPSLILMHGWDVTVTKLAGTDRSINWSIRQVA